MGKLRNKQISYDSGISFTGGNKIISNLADGVSANDAVNLSQLQATQTLIQKIEWKDSASNYVTDNTIGPTAGQEVTGNRLVLSHDGGIPHVNYDGATAGDIIEFDGASWISTTPTLGTFIAVDDEPSLLYYWGGADWSTKHFEATTASTGLTKVGFDVRLDSSAAGNGLTFNVNKIDLGGTLTGVTILDGGGSATLDIGGNTAGANLGQGRINATSFQTNNLTAYDGSGVGTAVNSNPGSFTITNNLSNNVGTAQFGGIIILNSVDSVANRTSQLAIEEDFVQLNATNTSTSESVTWEQTYNSFDLYARNSGPTELFRLKFDRANSKASFIDSRGATAAWGIQYEGFGEIDETGATADYSSLVGTSLVPKVWVEGQIAASPSIYTSDSTIGSGRVATLTDTLTFKGADLLGTSSNIKIVDSASASLWDFRNDGSLTGNKSKVNLIAQNGTNNDLDEYVFRVRNSGNSSSYGIITNRGYFHFGNSNSISNTDFSTCFQLGHSNSINSTSFYFGLIGQSNTLTGSGNDRYILGKGNNTSGGQEQVIIGVDNTVSGNFTSMIGSEGVLSGQFSSAIGRAHNITHQFSIGLGSWVQSGANGASIIGHGVEVDKTQKLVNNTTNSLALGWNSITPQHLFFQTGAYIGGSSAIGTEKISLQGSTLVNDKFEIQTTTSGFLMPRLTTAQMNAIAAPDTHLKILNTDEGREYRYNGSAWVSNEYVEYDFALRSGGTTTYYTDFYTCYQGATAGDIIDVQTDHTTDCGGIAKWSWDKDIAINLNGHHLTVTNLDYIGVEANVKIKMSNGTFEAISNSINQSSFNFVGATGTAYFEGDGAVNVFMIGGGSARGAFHQKGAGEVKISGVIMRGNASFCVKSNGTSMGRMYVDKCIMYTDEVTNTQAVASDNITVSNSTIYGQAISSGGSIRISDVGRDKARIFKNCNIIGGDGEIPIGTREAIFENCNIQSLNNYVRQGISGEQEYHNCKLERTGTAGTAFDVTNTVGCQCRFYNSEIISTGNGVRSNLPCEFYYTYIKASSGYGIDLTTSTFDMNVIIDNCYIDTIGGDCIYTGSINDGLNATITNTTLISRTDNEFCLNAPTGTYFKFAKNIFKNTVDSNDVYSRAGLVTENTQIQTTDSFGNIILD